jgi:3' terminal RNA ribose 2'-O-methyltransferase Hen1
MLLTISAPITGNDLGYLLHKNPSRPHTFDLAFGKAHVFYPQLSEGRSEAALLLDVDPIALVRGRPHAAEAGLHQYVNDRPYASSSFLSVAIAHVFGSAMNGRSKERQELADEVMEWSAGITALPCRGDHELITRLFEPLGYHVETRSYPLDETFPDWGTSPYRNVRISGRVRLRDLLTHVYVLVPVLDAEKHYWVGPDEVDKLLRRGETWLTSHPERDMIVRRYLRHDRRLTESALARLAEEDAPESDSESSASDKAEEVAVESPLQLWEQRVGAVLSALRAAGAESVIDLGCGEGKMLRALLKEQPLKRIVGMDVSTRMLEVAAKRLQLDRLAPAQKQRIELRHGSLVYQDARLRGFDAAIVTEVIEHLDSPRLAAFERVLFECAQPQSIFITTPNIEFNTLFPSLPAGRLRHKDHRFEWTRAEFQQWCERNASHFGYTVQMLPIGPVDPVAGSPTQMGVFRR